MNDKIGQALSGTKMTHHHPLVTAFLQTLQLKDPYTYGHSLRVARYGMLIGNQLNLTQLELSELEMALLLHDIGKIGTPDSILTKPQALNSEEFHIMKEHPRHSANVLSKFSSLENVSKAVQHHHEHFDGSGYPHNLKSQEIPLYSRIILIADTFDAMTSHRPYRRSLGNKMAVEEILLHSGTQFDPELTSLFVKSITVLTDKSQSL